MTEANAIEKGATGIISHHVDANRQAGYEAWLTEIGAVCKSYPGHLDLQVVLPIRGVTTNYTIIIRFDTHAHLHAWITSADRKQLIEKAKPFLAKDHYVIHSGLDFWFADGSTTKVPMRWKQFLVTWSAIYPIGLVTPIFIMPLMAKLRMPIENRFVTYFIISGVVVFLMAYWVMPHYTQLVRKWLYRY